MKTTPYEPARAVNGTDTEWIAARETNPPTPLPPGLEPHYDLLLEQLPIGVFHKDQAGRFVFVNRRFCHLQAATADEYIGKTAQDIAADRRGLDTVKRPRLGSNTLLNQGAGHHELIMQTGQTIETEEQYTNAQGEVLYFHAIKGPIRDRAGTVIGSQGDRKSVWQSKRGDL